MASIGTPPTWGTSCATQSRPSRSRKSWGRPHVTIAAKTIDGEKRWKLFGKTASRYLVVVFTIRRRLFRTVTAYEMNATERSKYATQIDNRS